MLENLAGGQRHPGVCNVVGVSDLVSHPLERGLGERHIIDRRPP